MKSIFRITCLLIILAGVISTLLPQPGFAQEERTSLSLRIIGDNYYYNYKVKVGQDNVLLLQAMNIGNTSISNISLSSISPDGWQIDFDPSIIDYISPGNYETAEITIRPHGRAERGEYRINIIAEANETREILTIRVTIESSLFWPWVGAGIAVILVAVFIFIFVRLNKQS